MLKKIIPLVTLFVLVFSMGCATRAVMLEDSKTYAPTSKVDILLEPPSRPYKKIAVIRGEGGIYTRIVERMRAKGKEIGADAVILGSEQTDVGVAKVGMTFFPVKDKEIEGVAIKYTD